jgi:flavin reductase (DIM6/NTAB) family NADH-FMN oxidoreductase RutF
MPGREESSMNKVLLGPRMLLFPRPVLLVGADVEGRPNFMAVAACGYANGDPPMLSVAIRHRHHTLKGIRRNLAFSVNMPSADLVREADYCGIVSGSKTDKAKVCRFSVFYGKLNHAPLIEQCPINLECKLVHKLDLGSHSLLIGQIEETHVSESCLTDGEPDVDKVNALMYTAGPDRQYRLFGQTIAKAHSVGLELKARE